MADSFKRQYVFSLVCYDNYENIKSVLERHDFVYAYFIEHDSDILETGELKPCHTHIVCCVRNATSSSAVLKWFSSVLSENVFIQEVKCTDKAIRYLIHYDDMDKFQYDLNSVQLYGDRKPFFKAFQSVSNEFDSSYLALVDVLNNTPLLECAKKYGRDFIYHYRDIEYLVARVKDELCRECK